MYQVVNKIGMWTYKIRPVDGKGQVKVRHFNELMPTRSHQEDFPVMETSETGAATLPEVEQNLQQQEVQESIKVPVWTDRVNQRPTRQRKPPERLVVNPQEKSYSGAATPSYFDDVFEEED